MREIIKKRRRKLAICSGRVFAGLLAVCFIGNILVKDRTFSDKENRMLAQKPKMQAEQMVNGRYEKQFEDYLNDQFLLRDMWVQTKATVDRLMGKTEGNGVYLGKSGYLIEKFQIPDDKKVEETISAMETFAKTHSDLKQYAMIVPNAVNVLDNKLPTFTPDSKQDDYLKAAKERFKGAGIKTIDPSKRFEELKEDTKLYYQTDHHWTTEAAYEAYQLAGEKMKFDTGAVTYTVYPVTDEFQGTLSAKSGFRSGKKEEIEIYLPDENGLSSVVNYVDEQKKSASFYRTEKLDTRDGYAVFFGGNHSQIKIKTPVEEDRRLLILKDSYANCLIPFLAQNYREIVVVDPRYYYDDLEKLIQVEEIQEVLYLYNANTFFSDTSLATVITPQK